MISPIYISGIDDIFYSSEREMDMTYGWNTSKTEAGYRWTVTGFEYGVGTKILYSGICSTRAKAVLRAKRHVMPLRRAAA